MGNRGRHDVQSHADGIMVVSAKWSHSLGAHGMTGTLISSTEGRSPTIVCGGAAEPSVFTLKFNADGLGNSLAPQVLYSHAKFTNTSGTFAASLNGVYNLHEVTGSSVNGEFVYRVTSGSLPNAGNVSPGTLVGYSASLDPGLVGTFTAIFKRNSR